ncbi:MAG: 2-dehydropantoate 2-reductase [Chloroflexi bacterium]|nr:2-dehydropantoate 2-reductase [Chloroflexota bacterium]
MRIAVMGTGGVGGYYGGLLARAGHQVTFIARGAHLAAIRANGLRVESATSGDFTLHPFATDDPRTVGPVELVLFCVKTYHNPQAIPAIAPLVGEGTVVLTLQNGVESGEQLAAAYGWEHVLPGATYIETAVKAQGVIAQTGGPCRIVFGEQDGAETPRSQRVLATLKGAGVNALLTRDIRKALWSKLVMICAVSGMTSITRAPLGEVAEFPPGHDLLLRVMQEAAAVGRAQGVALESDVAERSMQALMEFRREAVSSMQLDLLAGRRLEVDSINGAVVRLGRKAGVPTPVNEVIFACLKLADEQARIRQQTQGRARSADPKGEGGTMYFVGPGQGLTRQLAPGVTTRLAWGERIMLSVVELSPGSAVARHTHPHEQAGMVLEGELEMEIGAERRALRPGEMYIIPPNIAHAVPRVSGSAKVLDLFSPPREDYMGG